MANSYGINSAKPTLPSPITKTNNILNDHPVANNIGITYHPFGEPMRKHVPTPNISHTQPSKDMGKQGIHI